MSRYCGILLLHVLLGLGCGLAAQADYRNVDESTTLLVEDAAPIERYGFQWMLPYGFQSGPNGRQHRFAPEVDYGLFSNGMAGVALAGLLVEDRGRPSSLGLAGVRLFGLYNFLGETKGMPSGAIRVDALLPVGSLARSGGAITLKAIITRSLGAERVHVNFGRTWAGADSVNIERQSRWWAGVGVDHTLFRSSMLLQGELRAEQGFGASSLEYGLAFGFRRQMSPSIVLALGAARRFRERSWAFSLGVSRMFALEALLP